MEVYLCGTRRTSKGGLVVEYLQAAHHVRREGSPHPYDRVIHKFGRKDRGNPEALRRLVDPSSTVTSVQRGAWVRSA